MDWVLNLDLSSDVVQNLQDVGAAVSLGISLSASTRG